VGKVGLNSIIIIVKTAMEAIDEIDNLRTKTDNCLVIDGESLQLCLDHCIDEFIEMASLVPVVVCCRCSPTQKVSFAL
jgi:phospholipid-translocating ATPase